MIMKILLLSIVGVLAVRVLHQVFYGKPILRRDGTIWVKKEDDPALYWSIISAYLFVILSGIAILLFVVRFT